MTFEYVIKDSLGIHARPAGLVVAEAKKYQSAVTIEAKGKKADAKRIFCGHVFGVKCGDTNRYTYRKARMRRVLWRE